MKGLVRVRADETGGWVAATLVLDHGVLVATPRRDTAGSTDAEPETSGSGGDLFRAALTDVQRLCRVSLPDAGFAVLLELVQGPSRVLAVDSEAELSEWQVALLAGLNETIVAGAEASASAETVRAEPSATATPLSSVSSSTTMLNVNRHVRSRIFDMTIEQALWRDGQASTGVAKIVTSCIDFIERKGLDLEGIYRVSGAQLAISHFREACDRGEMLLFDESEDPNVVAGLLKLYLRSLAEPVIPFALYEAFTCIPQFGDEAVRDSLYKLLVNMLPDPNLALLRRLVAHLGIVIAHAPRNKMELHNIALLFGALLLRLRDETALEMMRNTGIASKCVALLVGRQAAIFDPSPPAFQPLSCVRAIYAFEPQAASELALSPGDIVFVTELEGEDWYVGCKPSGTGAFPISFVETVVEFPLALADVADLLADDGAAGLAREARAGSSSNNKKNSSASSSASSSSGDA